MAAIVFWFVIVPLAALALLGIVIKVVIPGVFLKAAGAAQGALDRNFEQDYQAHSVSDENMQRKLRLTFFSRWAMLVFGILLVAVPIVRTVSAGTMYLSELMPYLLVGALGIILIILAAGTMRRTKQLTALIAETVIREVFGADSRYDAFGHIPEECVAATGFVDDYEHIYGSDFVRGHYRGVPIMFSDVRLTRTDREYNTETKKYEEQEVDLFKGNWLVADFDRELAAAPLTVLERRSGSGSIQMESEAFNRQFSVYCADAHTAFYILTPHFMERLAAVDEAADGQSCFHFANNRLQIAVQTKRDLFEADTFKAPDVASLRTRFQHEIRQMTDVLDAMLAHERLFGPETGRRE
ncbi:MAG TPA: DUF3137 domain-containing protein [Syntrophomonas sp.]|nr:DUF3137 domain-containing protein [Syntrophomonas sp.]